MNDWGSAAKWGFNRVLTRSWTGSGSSRLAIAKRWLLLYNRERERERAFQVISLPSLSCLTSSPWLACSSNVLKWEGKPPLSLFSLPPLTSTSLTTWYHFGQQPSLFRSWGFRPSVRSSSTTPTFSLGVKRVRERKNGKRERNEPARLPADSLSCGRTSAGPATCWPVSFLNGNHFLRFVLFFLFVIGSKWWRYYLCNECRWGAS